MRVLSFETSGRIGSVALLETGAEPPRVLAERSLPATERTARSLLPAVQQVLAEAGWRPADLGLVCVTTGPGSFTGLRIGVVAAKTLAFATGARLAGVHTLAAIAAGAGRFETNLWTVLDAQRQELFVARFERGKSIADQPTPSTEILTWPHWLERLQAGDAVAGPPLGKFREAFPTGVTVLDESYWHPAAAATGRLGIELHDRGQLVDPLALVPHYYRKSAAEEKAIR